MLFTVLLVTALFSSPIAVTKLTTGQFKEKIEYTLPGNIIDVDNGNMGTVSLTFRGQIIGPPDYEDEYSMTESGEDMYDDYWEDYWTEDGIMYKGEFYYHKESTWIDEYSIQIVKWYSPQPTYNGKLIAIWQDGSTTTFGVFLNPLWIEHSTKEGTKEGEDYIHLLKKIYYYDEIVWWVPLDEEESEGSSEWSYDYSDSSFNLYFSGKIQSKGRPPLEGILVLWDYEYIEDSDEFCSISANGKFGPYIISAAVTV